MSRRNIHQSKRLKKRKAVPATKAVVQPAAVSQPAAATTSQSSAASTPVKTASVKAAPVQEVAAVRFAELPYELRRIALFSASVVVLLIVLWFFLK